MVSKASLGEGANGQEFEEDHQPNSQHGKDVHEDDLDVEAEEATPGRHGEGTPGVLDGRIAFATQNGRADGAAEGSVECNNGVLGLGEQRGLDADENSLGGDNEAEAHDDGDDDHHDRLQGLSRLPSFGRHVGVFALGVVHTRDRDAQQIDQSNREDVRGLKGQPVDDCRQSGCVESAAEGRKAVPEVGRGSTSYDDMDPGSV